MIEKAEYLQDYKIKVWFNDGNMRIINLYPLMKKSTHPLTRKFLDKELFEQFYIEDGTLCWGDNEFDINPFKVREGLYDAKEMKSKTK